MFFLEGGILVVLSAMVYQDFRYRGIVWWLFPALLVALYCYNSMLTNPETTFKNGTINCSFIFLQIVFLTLYVSVKTKKLTNIFSGYFGLGDLLFLLCIAFAMRPAFFIVFYLVSLFITILLAAVLPKVWINQDTKKIPLAGYQAMMMILFLILNISDFHLQPMVENIIRQYI